MDIYLRELTLRIKEDEVDIKDSSGPDLAALPSVALDSIPELEAKDRSLVCLLGQEPYKAAPSISHEGRQALAQLRNQAKGLGTSGEIVITPALLRHFAQITQKFDAHMMNMILGINEIQARLLLQDHEFTRQRKAYMDMKAKIEYLKGDRHIKLLQRFENAIAEQRRLLGRSDRVLQQWMDSSSPTLNEHEKRWFAEMKRMKSDVLGDSPYDAGSLKSRTETVSIWSEIKLYEAHISIVL